MFNSVSEKDNSERSDFAYAKGILPSTSTETGQPCWVLSSLNPANCVMEKGISKVSGIPHSSQDQKFCGKLCIELV